MSNSTVSDVVASSDTLIERTNLLLDAVLLLKSDLESGINDAQLEPLLRLASSTVQTQTLLVKYINGTLV